MGVVEGLQVLLMLEEGKKYRALEKAGKFEKSLALLERAS
jgi:hypothetical protein